MTRTDHFVISLIFWRLQFTLSLVQMRIRNTAKAFNKEHTYD